MGDRVIRSKLPEYILKNHIFSTTENTIYENHYLGHRLIVL
jgi:hypothetical protein